MLHPLERLNSTSEKSNRAPSVLDLFTFPVAEAAPLVLTEKTPEEKRTQENYGSWLKEGIKKPESLNRQKRAFKEGTITLEQIVKVGFEQYLGINADPAFEKLRAILGKDKSHWASYGDPDAKRFKVIKAAIVKIIKTYKHANKMLTFISNTIGAFHTSAMDNNEDFRRSYMFYTHENEKSINEKGTFFYHADVEDLFPSAYRAYDKGINYFQQMPAEVTGLKANRINLYALILHHQSSGKPLNYKSLAMAFAHIDISNFAIKGLCHYLTMSVMIGLEDLNLDAIADMREMLSDLYKLSTSDPITYFRIAHLLESANNALLNPYSTLPDSSGLVRASALYQQ